MCTLLTSFASGLQNAKKTLEFLEVNDEDGIYDETEEPQLPFGSFSDFQKLKEIKTSSFFLLGDQETYESDASGAEDDGLKVS